MTLAYHPRVAPVEGFTAPVYPIAPLPVLVPADPHAVLLDEMDSLIDELRQALAIRDTAAQQVELIHHRLFLTRAALAGQSRMEATL